MGSLVLAVITALVAAHPHDPPIVERAEATPMQPTPTTTFVPGPELRPADQLKAWLDAQGQRDPQPLLKLPVTIVTKGPAPLSMREAWIGTHSEVDTQTLILILDDTALGIPLQDQLQPVCPAEGGRCQLWLEGTWGPLVPLANVSEGFPVLAVRKVAGPIGEGDEIRPYVEEEAM